MASMSKHSNDWLLTHVHSKLDTIYCALQKALNGFHASQKAVNGRYPKSRRQNKCRNKQVGSQQTQIPTEGVQVDSPQSQLPTEGASSQGQTQDDSQEPQLSTERRPAQEQARDTRQGSTKGTTHDLLSKRPFVPPEGGATEHEDPEGAPGAPQRQVQNDLGNMTGLRRSQRANRSTRHLIEQAKAAELPNDSGIDGGANATLATPIDRTQEVMQHSNRHELLDGQTENEKGNSTPIN